MSKKPNWIEIRNEYVMGTTSYRKLAEKYGVSLRTLSNRAKKENWVTLKDTTCDKIATKVSQKTIEKISEETSDRCARHVFLVDKVLDACEKILSEQLTKGVDMFGNEFDSSIVNHSKVARLMETLEKAQKCHRIAEGLIDAIDLKRLELEDKKVLIAAKKAGQDDEELPDDGFIEALNAEAGKVWDDEEG